MNLRKSANLFATLCCVFYCHVTFAAGCKPNETVLNDYEPAGFSTSNDLLRKAGQTPLFCGERVIIYGKLVDEDCKPISDAKIYLWQVDCSGKYPYTPLRNLVDSELIKLPTKGETFTGNGIATTNNLGEFVFVTIYPNKVHDMKPHLNIRVELHNHEPFQTILSMHNHRLYNLEATIQNDSMLNLIRDYGSKVYGFKVVIPR
jgi:protocatechuate 3,4-dioxygenase beta subunit